MLPILNLHWTASETLLRKRPSIRILRWGGVMRNHKQHFVFNNGVIILATALVPIHATDDATLYQHWF